MVTQKPILVKLDKDLLKDIDELVGQYPNMNRNRYINGALLSYVRITKACIASRFIDTDQDGRLIYDSKLINIEFHKAFGSKFNLK